MLRHITTRGSLLLVLALVLVPVLAAAFPAAASAALLGCRSDPTVLLSDGTTLDVIADIDTSLLGVNSVNYVVHGPPGVKMVLVVRTPSLLYKEYFTYKDDAQPGQYITETLVKTTKTVKVTSRTTLVKVTLSGLKITLAHEPIPGWSGQTLTAVLEP